MNPPALIQPLGDSATLVTLGAEIDEATNNRVHALAASLKARNITGCEDVVASFASLAVYFNPLRVTAAEVEAQIRSLLDSDHAGGLAPAGAAHHRIPVVYNGEDLDFLAEATGLSRDKVVALHTGRHYRAFAIGFAPGFAYLGTLDVRLSVPRKDAPRLRVPAGSVAIAGRQTAVYPLETAGGWQIIGRTNVPMFDAQRSPPALIQAGDTVEFISVAS